MKKLFSLFIILSFSQIALAQSDRGTLDSDSSEVQTEAQKRALSVCERYFHNFGVRNCTPRPNFSNVAEALAILQQGYHFKNCENDENSSYKISEIIIKQDEKGTCSIVVKETDGDTRLTFYDGISEEPHQVTFSPADADFSTDYLKEKAFNGNIISVIRDLQGGAQPGKEVPEKMHSNTVTGTD